MDTNVESSTNYTHPELIMVAETVAREKGIEKEEVFDAMEQAIQKPVVPSTGTSMISAPRSTANRARSNWRAISRLPRKSRTK